MKKEEEIKALHIKAYEKGFISCEDVPHLNHMDYTYETKTTLKSKINGRGGFDTRGELDKAFLELEKDIRWKVIKDID